MTTGATMGERLRARRVELGLTLAAVAQKAELSLPYVSNLERGRGNPTIEALTALAHALEVPLAAVVGGEEAGDPLDAAMASAPKSLLRFAKTQRFSDAVAELAKQAGESPSEMRRRLLVGMASAPRRSAGEPSDEDWRRLLDTYSLIIRG